MGRAPTARGKKMRTAAVGVVAVLVLGCSGAERGSSSGPPATVGPGAAAAAAEQDAAPAPTSIVGEDDGSPDMVVFGDDGILELPLLSDPPRGPLPEECPETIWHREFGTFAIEVNSLPDDGPDGGENSSLLCILLANGAGGTLRWSWATGLARSSITDRDLVEMLVVCPSGVCGPMPNDVPDYEFGQADVSLGDGGRLNAAVYERTVEQAAALDSTPGLRGFVRVDFKLGEVLCSGSWGGPVPSGQLPVSAIELAVDAANMACGATSGATSVGAPPTTTTLVVPNFPAVAADFGLVEYESAGDMPREEVEYWARAYLGLLAEGQYPMAATLLGAPARLPEDRSLELLPLGEEMVTDDLDDQLRAWCSTDGVCSPALDPYPNVWSTDMECFESAESDVECSEFREGWLDPGGETWRLGFTVAAPDGTALRLHPSAARPENVVISVGVFNGRVWMRGLPPSRTFGDPATRLPQLTVVDTAAIATFEVPGTNVSIELSTDGRELCVSLRTWEATGGGGSTGRCSDDLAPLAGMLDLGLGVSGGAGAEDPASLTAFVVDAGVGVEALDPDGEPLDLVARFEAPEVTNGAIWLFAGPFDFGRFREYRTTFTLPDGTTVQQ